MLQPTDPRNSANQINQSCQQEPGNHTKGEGDAQQHPPTTNQRREPKLNLPVSGRENQTVPACTLIGHENRDPDQSVLEPKLANTRIGDPTLIHPFAFKQIVTSTSYVTHNKDWVIIYNDNPFATMIPKHFSNSRDSPKHHPACAAESSQVTGAFGATSVNWYQPMSRAACCKQSHLLLLGVSRKRGF